MSRNASVEQLGTTPFHTYWYVSSGMSATNESEAPSSRHSNREEAIAGANGDIATSLGPWRISIKLITRVPLQQSSTSTYNSCRQTASPLHGLEGDVKFPPPASDTLNAAKRHTSTHWSMRSYTQPSSKSHAPTRHSDVLFAAQNPSSGTPWQNAVSTFRFAAPPTS